jgi:hypothetical protein
MTDDGGPLCRYELMGAIIVTLNVCLIMSFTIIGLTQQAVQPSAKGLQVNQLVDHVLAGLIAPSIDVLFMDRHCKMKNNGLLI